MVKKRPVNKGLDHIGSPSSDDSPMKDVSRVLSDQNINKTPIPTSSRHKSSIGKADFREEKESAWDSVNRRKQGTGRKFTPLIHTARIDIPDKDSSKNETGGTFGSSRFHEEPIIDDHKQAQFFSLKKKLLLNRMASSISTELRSALADNKTNSQRILHFRHVYKYFTSIQRVLNIHPSDTLGLQTTPSLAGTNKTVTVLPGVFKRGESKLKPDTTDDNVNEYLDKYTKRGTPRIRRAKRDLSAFGDAAGTEATRYDTKVSGRVPKELNDQLLATAEARGVSQSALLTQALHELLSRLSDGPE